MSDNFIDPTFSEQVIWNGSNIACLGICKGQSISKVAETIALKVCEVAEPENLSTLSLDCVIEMFNSIDPVNRTIKNVLQLLSDNQCNLKELIDNLQSQILGITVDNFVINLNCLALTDNLGNPLQTNRDGVIQLLVNDLCSLKSNVIYINTKLTDIQNQIDNLDLTPTITEPSITTCVEPSSSPTSSQVKKVAAALCSIRQDIGNTSEIVQARTLVPIGLNSRFGSIGGWIPTTSNLAQDYGNLNIVINYLLTKIDELESCCDKECDALTLGFAIDATDNGIILSFSSIYGTNIPTGFINAGSTLTVVEEGTNYSATFTLPISQDYVSSEISLGGFTKGKTLLFTLNSKMSKNSKLCQKLFSKSWKYVSQGCCQITNLDSNSQTIIYEQTI